jgi:hypothetical protein
MKTFFSQSSVVDGGCESHRAIRSGKRGLNLVKIGEIRPGVAATFDNAVNTCAAAGCGNFE